MTEPIDQATKERIEDEAKYYADEFTDDGAYKFLNAQKFDAYIAGATVWAERLKQQEKEVSLRESQQDVMAADTVKLMDQIEYQKKAAKKDYDMIKKLEFRLKQERNKAIDECIEVIRNTEFWPRIINRLESLKDKSHE